VPGIWYIMHNTSFIIIIITTSFRGICCLICKAYAASKNEYDECELIKHDRNKYAPLLHFINYSGGTEEDHETSRSKVSKMRFKPEISWVSTRANHYKMFVREWIRM
jgi:hypothetical protein